MKDDASKASAKLTIFPDNSKNTFVYFRQLVTPPTSFRRGLSDSAWNMAGASLTVIVKRDNPPQAYWNDGSRARSASIEQTERGMPRHKLFCTGTPRQTIAFIVRQA